MNAKCTIKKVFLSLFLNPVDQKMNNSQWKSAWAQMASLSLKKMIGANFSCDIYKKKTGARWHVWIEIQLREAKKGACLGPGKVIPDGGYLKQVVDLVAAKRSQSTTTNGYKKIENNLLCGK